MTDEEALARKKNVRGAHRASATRLMNQADTLLAATPMDADVLQTTLSAKLKTLETLNAEIEELTPEAQLEDEIGRADEYSEKDTAAYSKGPKTSYPYPRPSYTRPSYPRSSYTRPSYPRSSYTRPSYLRSSC